MFQLGNLLFCRKDISSATPETLAVLCEENRLALIEELGLAEEDLVKVWVSEMQKDEQCGVSGVHICHLLDQVIISAYWRG